MQRLPEAIQSYFESALYGLEALLPWGRIQNKPLLELVYQALLLEPAYTPTDIAHIQALITLADRFPIPVFIDSKSLIETEAYLLVVSCLPQTQIRYCLEYLYFLLCRHGLIPDVLSQSRLWLSIWRVVQRFEPLAQGLVVDYIRWLCDQSFRSIYDCVLELLKFQTWRTSQNPNTIEEVSNLTLAQYLEGRGKKLKPSTRKRALGNLRTFFHYYKTMVNGGYSIPELSVYAPTCLGLNQSANSLEVKKLLEILENNVLPPEEGLMLAFVLGFGLPLKALPLLRITSQPGRLLYHDQRPSRLGVIERVIQLPTETPWLNQLFLAYLQQRGVPPSYPYLFVTPYALKRLCPVSVEYCQGRVQSAIQKVLGYPLAVNHLERGAVKALARQLTLTDFMSQTQAVPLTRQTRMMYWLYQRKNHG